MGIRPEHFLSADEAKKEKDCCIMTVKTEIAEMTGSETNIYFELGEKRCIARIKSEEKICSGDCVKLAFKSTSAYFFDKETKIPCHCFNAETKSPLGIYGWGRGCAWWAIGITDSLKTLMESKTYNIEKVKLLKYCVEFAAVMKNYQREDGAFTRMIFTPSLEDSSAGAMLAYCFAYIAKLTESDELEDCCKKTLRHLKTCTRRNGVIDYAQGDTMGIGFYSDSLRVVPAAQGFAVAAIKEIDF